MSEALMGQVVHEDARGELRDQRQGFRAGLTHAHADDARRIRLPREAAVPGCLLPVCQLDPVPGSHPADEILHELLESGATTGLRRPAAFQTRFQHEKMQGQRLAAQLQVRPDRRFREHPHRDGSGGLVRPRVGRHAWYVERHKCPRDISVAASTPGNEPGCHGGGNGGSRGVDGCSHGSRGTVHGRSTVPVFHPRRDD